MTKVHPCSCKHASQDKLHGPRMRVWNEAPGRGNANKGTYRCTVCGATKKI